jgi:hypothetical protein
MSRDVCPDEVALGAILERGEDDPYHAHVQTCPRCRALAHSHRAFVAAADDGGLYGAKEDRRLARFRSSLLEGGPPARESGRRLAWWHRLAAPAMRPAWALTTAAVLVGAYLLWPQAQLDRPDGMVRSGAPSVDSEEAAVPVVELRPGGGARFTWSAHADADRYEIRFTSAAFEDLGHIDAGTGTSLDVAPDQMPTAYANGQLVLVQVIALRKGDEVFATHAIPLRRP